MSVYPRSQEQPDLYWSVDNIGYAVEFEKSSGKIVKGAMVVAHHTNYRTLYTTAGFINMVAIAESVSSL